MSLFSSTQPSLRARILPRFPAQVLAGTGITISKSGGVYTFAVAPYANIPLTAIANIGTDRLLGRDTAGSGAPEELSVSQGISFTGSGGIGLAANQRIRFIAPAPITSLTTGIKADLFVPFACTVSQWTLLADASMSIVIDVWRDSYANYPPTVADTMTGTGKPTISSAVKAQGNTSLWGTTSIAAGDTLRFNVDSVTAGAATRVVLSLDAVTV